MRRGIFRGVLIWVLLSSILFSNASCKLDQKLYEVQICEDIKTVDIIEPKNNDRCMSDYEYLNIKKRFNNYIANKGFVYHFSRNSLPRRVNCVCTADKANDLVIDADGRLYKCWTDIGKQNLGVGDIKDGISKNPIYLRYVGMDPTMDLECRECKYLPICLSGCPANRHDKKEGTCLESSANLKSAVYSIVENYSIDLSNQ